MSRFNHVSRSVIGAVVAMSVGWISLGYGAAYPFAGGTETQRFDTAASATLGGWTLQNGTTGGNSFGFSNSSNAGGTPGEGGGSFQRPNNIGYYSDLTLDKYFTVSTSLRASGQIDLTQATATATDNSVVLGYWDTNRTVASSLDPNSPVNNDNWLGFRYRLQDGQVLANAFGGDYGGYTVGGTDAGLANSATMADGTYWFSFEYVAYEANGVFASFLNPGEITLTLSNITTTAVTTLHDALHPAQNRSTKALNAFGFVQANSTSDANNPGMFFADDLIYSGIPEPSAALLVGLGVATLWRRRIRK